MSPLDLSSVEGGQQRLETVAQAKESSQELKQKLAQYRQTYINEVDAQKASLTASLGSFQDVDAKAYVEKAAAALGTSVTNLAAEGENLQAKGKLAESGAGADKTEKKAKEGKLDMSTLAGLKDTVRTEMSAQRAELAIWQKMENIVARFNKERGSEGDGKAPTVTLENLSLFMAGRQQKVNALTALKTQYQAIGETKSGSNKQALEETPKDMADAITPFEQDIATAKEAAQIQSELADLGRSLRPIESALLAKKTLTPSEYNQYLGQLNGFGRARLEAIGALSSKGSPFNGLADAINTRIQQPFLARVSRLHGMLEARKPEGSAEKNQKLEDEGAYNEHEFQLFKQKNALLLANISKEADALAKEHQAAKKKPELWNNSADFAAWSERLAKCDKSAEEVKTATKPWIEISKLNGQAQDFLTSTLHPLEGKISTLKNVAAPERKKDVEAREKEIIGSRVQEMVTALEAQWQEKEQDSKGLLRTADTLSKLDENSEEYKEAVKNQDALFSFVLSFESKIGFFLTKPDDLAPELVTKIKDLQSKGKDWRQIIIGDRALRATLRAAAEEKKISHTVPAVEEWKTGRGPNGPERHLVQVSPERHEEYNINDYIEFVNPLDPVNQTNNKSRGWVWKKENLPAEVKQTLEQRADIIVSEQKQKAEADAAREANKVGLENSLTERGKEALLPQAAKYFEAADLLAKGNTTAAVAAYTEYLNQSLQFTAEDRELHKSCIADARNKVEVDKQFPEYLEALQLQSRGLMEDAIKAFRKLVEKIKALPLDEQKKYQEQLNVGLEVIQQYNGDKLRLLSELSEDFIYLESIKRANMTLKGTANALDYLKLGTSPEDLEKARKMPAAAREILLPFLPAHLLTAQEKSRVANRTAGLQGPEISTMKEEIRLLGEKIAAGGKTDESLLAEIKELKGKVDAGDPDSDAIRARIKELEEKAARGAAVVNFEEEYQKIKQKLKPNTELEPGGVGWQDPNTGEYLASGPSSRLMAFFDQINSTDPAKREKGFLAIANEFKDQEVGMRFTQKYLRQAMLRRYRDFDAQDKGRLRETVKRRIATDKKTVAEVEANTRAAWEHWVKEENARPANPGEEKSEILLDPPDPLVYQSFRQKTFDSVLDYQYEREMRKVMTDRGDATEDSALAVYNWSMPHDADDAHWIKLWSWKNYSEDEWIDFKAQATEITIQTLATLPIGWGAGTLGRGAGMGITRLLTSSIGKGLSAEAVELLASGGVQALRASPKVWKGLSAGMRAKLMAARVTGYTLGLAVEGTSLALMNNVWEGMYSGKSDLFDAIDNGKYGAAGLKLLKSIAQAGLFRMTGGAQSGIEGLAGAASGLPARLITKIAGEAVSGSGGAGVEALFMMMEGQGKQITWDWFARSMVQNAASSVGMHAGHKGLIIPKMGFMRGSKQRTYRELNAAEQSVTRERLSEMGIQKPSDILGARLDHATGEMVLTIAGQDKPRRIPSTEIPFGKLPEDLQLSIYQRDKANRESTAQSLQQSGLDNPANWGRILEDGSVISLTGHTVKFPDIELLPPALKTEYQRLLKRQGLEPYRAPGTVEPSPPATPKPAELPAGKPANDNATSPAISKPPEVAAAESPAPTPSAPRPSPELPPRRLPAGEAARRVEQIKTQLDLFSRSDRLAIDPTTNAKALAEVDAQIAAAAKERNLSPEQYRRQLLSEAESYRGLDALDRSERQLYGESKVIRKPVLDANGKQVTDAQNKPVYEEVNLFANYQSKSSAYSREMLRSLSYEQLVAEGGGKIIKLGGDELVVYHAGPDGTVQKLFIDISNMGPTNDTATNIAGSKVNLVDIYLHRLSEAVLAQSKASQGKLLDPTAFNAEVQRVADSLFNLDRDANGTPLTEADAQKNFDRLKAEWGLEGNFQEYQTDMRSMRILAEYRSDTRALDASYKKHPERSFSEHIAAEVEAVSGMAVTELQRLIAAHPQQFREAFDSRLPKSPKLNSMPADQLMERIAALDPARSKPEELMVLYALMARVDTAKLAEIPAVKPLTDRLAASRQALVGEPPHPRVEEPRLMDAKVVTINLPPEIARALSSLAESDPVQAHAILTAARQFSEKSLDALKYGRRGAFAEFNVTDFVEIKNGQLKIREHATDFRQAVETAQTDKKIGNVVDVEDSLRVTRARMEDLQQQLAERKISHDQFFEKSKEIEREIAALQNRLSIDPDTGAYSQSYLDIRPSVMYSFPDGVLASSYRVWNSVVTELGHSGVINAKYGYQAMDGVMAEYCQILREGIAAELPANLQHFKIIRSGGGKFEVAFLDSRAVEHLAQKGLTPHQLVERLANGPGQQAIDRILQTDPQKAAASQSDAAVRNSQFIFNKGTEAVAVGRLTSRVETVLDNSALQKAFTSNPEISARGLLALAREQSKPGTEPKPARPETLPSRPHEQYQDSVLGDYQGHLNLIPRIEGGHYGADPRYLRIMGGAVENAATMLRSGEHKSVSDVLNQLAAERARVGVKDSYNEDAGAFGRPRRMPGNTPIVRDGPYQSYYDEAQTIVRTKGTTVGDIADPDIKAAVQSAISQNIGVWPERVVPIVETLPSTGEKILLTVIGDNENGKLWWIHTSPENSRKIMDYVEQLFQRTQKPDLPQSELIATVAEMHWWIAHAMPYERGSAAISDALSKTLLLQHGIRPGRWQVGIMPDIKAFHTPREQFIREYATYFEHSDTAASHPETLGVISAMVDPGTLSFGSQVILNDIRAMERYQKSEHAYDPVRDPEYQKLENNKAKEQYLQKKTEEMRLRIITEKTPAETRAKIITLAAQMVGGEVRLEKAKYKVAQILNNDHNLPLDWRERIINNSKARYRDGETTILILKNIDGQAQDRYLLLSAETIVQREHMFIMPDFEHGNAFRAINKEITAELDKIKAEVNAAITTIKQDQVRLEREQKESARQEKEREKGKTTTEAYPSVEERANRITQRFHKRVIESLKKRPLSINNNYYTRSLREYGRRMRNDPEIKGLPPAERRIVLAERIRQESERIRQEIYDKQKTISEISDVLFAVRKENPALPAEELLKLFQQEAKERGLTLTREENAQIERTIGSFSQKQEAVTRYYQEFQNKPTELFFKVFGFMPTGKVELVNSNFSINFRAHSIEDVQKIHQMLTHEDYSESTAAFHIPNFSRVGELSGLINVVKGWGVREGAERIYIQHEERHALNTILLPDAILWGQLLAVSHDISDIHDLRVVCQRLLPVTLKRAQDEISAYQENGVNQKDLTEALAGEVSNYDYWTHYREGTEERIIKKLVGSKKAEESEQDYLTRQEKVKEEVSTIFEEYRELHKQRVREMVAGAFENRHPVLNVLQTPNLLARAGRRAVPVVEAPAPAGVEAAGKVPVESPKELLLGMREQIIGDLRQGRTENLAEYLRKIDSAVEKSLPPDADLQAIQTAIDSYIDFRMLMRDFNTNPEVKKLFDLATRKEKQLIMRSGGVEIERAWNILLAEHPVFETLRVKQGQISQNNVLAHTGGQFIRGFGASIDIMPTSRDHYLHLMETRPTSVQMVAERLGIPREAMTPELLRTFIILHELGHAQDYLSRGQEDRDKSWSIRSKEDMASLPVPDQNPATLLNAIKAGELTGMLQTISDPETRRLAEKAAQGDQPSIELLVSLQEKAYKATASERIADDFATDFIKRHAAEMGLQLKPVSAPSSPEAPSARVPRDMLNSGFSDTPPTGLPRDSAGWITEDGRIFYNSKALNPLLAEGYTMESSPRGAVIRSPRGEMLTFGQYRDATKNTASEGMFRPLLERMIEIKNHEAMHRVTTLVENPSQFFAEQNGTEPLPQGKISLTDKNGKPLPITPKNVDEFISRVADGTQKITATDRRTLEQAIAANLAQRGIPNFTFARTRTVDTRLLATNPREAFHRDEAAAASFGSREAYDAHRGRIDNYLMELQKGGVTGTLPATIRSVAQRRLSLFKADTSLVEVDKAIRASAREVLGSDFEFYDAFTPEALGQPQQPQKPEPVTRKPIQEYLTERSRESLESVVDGILAASPERAKINLVKSGSNAPSGPKPATARDYFAGYNKQMEDAEVPLPKPVTPSEVINAEGELSNLYQRYGATNDGGQWHFARTEQGVLPEGMELRKVYLSPPINGAARYLDVLLQLSSQRGIRWQDMKTNFGDVHTTDTAGNAVKQGQNALCVYFTNDAEFNRFIEVAAEAERQSGVALLQYPKEQMRMYGQALDGKINFGIDLPGGGTGTNFDGWRGQLIYAASEVRARGGSREEIRTAINNKLRELRGVASEDYLDMAQNVEARQYLAQPGKRETIQTTIAGVATGGNGRIKINPEPNFTVRGKTEAVRQIAVEMGLHVEFLPDNQIQLTRPRISPEMLTSGFSDTPPTGLPRDSAGWITEDGRIFYNSKALNPLLAEGYTMESSTRGAVIRSPRGERLTLGQYRDAIKNTASEGMFRPLLERMIEIKNHEAMHRVTTLVENPSQFFAEQNGAEPLPQGKISLTDKNGKPLPITAKNVDEFICRVADGTQPIDPAQRLTLERAIAKDIPGFTFARVRNVDTRLLASNPKESFRRLEAAAKQAETSGQPWKKVTSATEFNRILSQEEGQGGNYEIAHQIMTDLLWAVRSRSPEQLELVLQEKQIYVDRKVLERIITEIPVIQEKVGTLMTTAGGRARLASLDQTGKLTPATREVYRRLITERQIIEDRLSGQKEGVDKTAQERAMDLENLRIDLENGAIDMNNSNLLLLCQNTRGIDVLGTMPDGLSILQRQISRNALDIRKLSPVIRERLIMDFREKALQKLVGVTSAPLLEKFQELFTIDRVRQSLETLRRDPKFSREKLGTLPSPEAIILSGAEKLPPEALAKLLEGDLLFNTVQTYQNGELVNRRIMYIEGKSVGEAGGFGQVNQSFIYDGISPTPKEAVTKQMLRNENLEENITYLRLPEIERLRIKHIINDTRFDGTVDCRALTAAKRQIEETATRNGIGRGEAGRLSEFLDARYNLYLEARNSRLIMERQASGEMANFMKVEGVSEDGTTLIFENLATPNQGVRSFKNIIEGNVEVPSDMFWGGVLDVIGGLREAHASGIYHMDIKPHNIILGPDNRAKIIDYGTVLTDSDIPKITFIADNLPSEQVREARQNRDEFMFTTSINGQKPLPVTPAYFDPILAYDAFRGNTVPRGSVDMDQFRISLKDLTEKPGSPAYTRLMTPPARAQLVLDFVNKVITIDQFETGLRQYQP